MKHLNSARTPLAILILLVAASWSASELQARSWRVVTPKSNLDIDDWTAKEKRLPLARRLIRRTDEASFHLLRIRESEVPHVHDEHDLTVTVLSGRSRIHFKTRSVLLRRGDIVHVPRGEMHWAEVLGDGPLEVHAVFTPPLDGKDFRKVNEKAR